MINCLNFRVWSISSSPKRHKITLNDRKLKQDINEVAADDNRQKEEIMLRKLEEQLFLVQIVQWMALSDFIFEFTICWNYLSVLSPSTFDSINSNYKPIFWCKLKGFIQQSFTLGSVLWNFVLGLTLFCIMYLDTNPLKIRSNMKIYAMIVWCITFCVSCVPFVDQQYGYVHNSDGTDYQCWIKNSGYQLCLYLPVLICVVLCFMFMLLCVYHRYKKGKPQVTGVQGQELIPDGGIPRAVAGSINDNENKKRFEKLYTADNTSSQIILFTCAFIIAWSGPLSDRMYDMVTADTVPTWLTEVHDTFLGAIGLVNGLIWLRSSLWKQYEMYDKASADFQNDQQNQNDGNGNNNNNRKINIHRNINIINQNNNQDKIDSVSSSNQDLALYESLKSEN